MNIEIMVKAIRVAKIRCLDCDEPMKTDPISSPAGIHFECSYCGHINSLDLILEKHEKVLKLLSVALLMEEAMKDE